LAVAERVGARATERTATFGSRLAAYMLDWLVTFILACLFVAAGGLMLLRASDMGRTDPSDSEIFAFFIIVSLVVPVWAVMTVTGWAWYGRSVGKLAMNLRVVGRNGRRPGLPRSLVRLVVYALESLPLALVAPVGASAWMLRANSATRPVMVVGAVALALPIVSVIVLLRDRSHRALHDLAAGTMVVTD
jgi:uncharacterized RDD family membrane protein YckC